MQQDDCVKTVRFISLKLRMITKKTTLRLAHFSQGEKMNSFSGWWTFPNIISKMSKNSKKILFFSS